MPTSPPPEPGATHSGRPDDATGPATSPQPESPDALAAEVRALREELAFVRRHKMFLLFQSVPRVLLFRFAAGMAAGLGTVIGATVLLSLIIWALSQIEFIPIIGEWAVRIASEIEEVLNGTN